ncbi:MAG: lamin tail domain-containing protein [Anaerolineales bacterium]|nr:lamin tail domain-containing protein [Anaerolineales bacterium]
MKPWKRLVVYLLLNVIVTGLTMLTILYLWDTTQIKDLMYSSLDGTAKDQPVQISTTAAGEDAGAGTREIEIKEIGGVGNLSTEYVLLKRGEDDTQETISLQNWVLRDEDGHEFSILSQSGINSLELHPKGAVYVYTKSGESNPIELYLGLSDPLWNPGETVTLINPNGQVHDTHLIP